MSYVPPQISGLNKKGPKYKHSGYVTDLPIIPHGISVALTGPAVFQFTAPSSPDRHREALAIFTQANVTDPSITSIPDKDIGAHLYEAIARFLDGLGVPRGLKAIGYTTSDLGMLVEGTLPQRRVLDLAPGIGDVIVGGTLSDASPETLKTNFVASQSPGDFARLYRDNKLEGGHVIKLGPGNDAAAREALAAWPGGLQIGGGIDDQNAQEWINAGASKVIVTSYLFPNAKFSLERLKKVSSVVGKDRLVVDVRQVLHGYDWEVFISNVILVVAGEEINADVEGLCQGIDEELVRKLGQWIRIPTTYAGGAKDLGDLDLVEQLSGGRVDLTYGRYVCPFWNAYLNQTLSQCIGHLRG
ncbi:hypothetical protein C0993_004407 [Termitomyces sp. T159_Od127]|nr:hypothetical protein C0993_004407 [Termitomyces sp. T159_Od127]